MDEMNAKLANQLYQMVKDLLSEMDIAYEENTEQMRISFEYPGDDMPHRMHISVYPDSGTLRFLELLPFDVPTTVTAEISDAINRINSLLAIGNYYYDNEDTIFFCISHLFLDSIVGRETLMTLIRRTVQINEEFDDRLLAVSKGYLKPENVLQGLE